MIGQPDGRLMRCWDRSRLQSHWHLDPAELVRDPRRLCSRDVESSSLQARHAGDVAFVMRTPAPRGEEMEKDRSDGAQHEEELMKVSEVMT